MANYRAPGLYKEEITPAPAPGFLTGIPAFLGYADRAKTPINQPQLLTLWPQFGAQFGPLRADGYLAHAVRGFFANDGLLAYVVRLDDQATPLNALRAGLAALDPLENVDLVCAPDIMRPASDGTVPDLAGITALQTELLAYCARWGDRFAILDGVGASDTSMVQQQRAALTSDYGALYYPWLWVAAEGGQTHYVPPCGHVAGSYARSDQRNGVHKAPANEVLNEVLDLRVNLEEQTLGLLYEQGVNCLHSFPGRGIRVWGARTLSADPAWRYVNARRIFLTVSRWLERFLSNLVLEPNDIRLWVRILRELTAYLDALFRRGALRGRTPAEAFYVKCDSETNPPAVIAAGMVVTQIGLALAAPAEFIVARITHGASGVEINLVA